MKFITENPEMIQVLKLVKQTARYGSSLMIRGESGTGKDLLAKFYHNHSSRRSGSFIQVDCASIPPDLIESELFGHEKGAFTGAYSQRIGRFEAANSGTLFLDHVEELPVQVQSKLSRVLQENRFERLGGNEIITVDLQVVSSTRNNLDFLIREGLFREDLYFRLSVVPVALPPLRVRKGDIPLLVKHFLEAFTRKHSRPAPRFSVQALEILCSYPWPGNVRELENFMERVIISYQDGKEILSEELPLHFDNVTEMSLDAFADNHLTLQEIEKIYIRRVLYKVKGNKTKAAQILGINRKTLLEKRRRYDLN
ncbi:sigma-54-dependent Fis family transcriptional regulator [bacterium]|nr:sigma-54-dependent Fis family transcriptional regulator [candidate division CSSED10-310 bacterium]